MRVEQPQIEELADVIAQLRREADQLDQAMKLRGLIEQAKGVLMAEHRVGADAAFDLLRSMSQRENARLVDVAATVVGVTLPEEMRVDLDESALPQRLRPTTATSQRWLATRGQPAVRGGVAGAVVDVLAAGTTDGTEAAQLVADLLAPLDVAAVALWRVRADDSLELVGQVGYPSDTMSAWRRIPISVDVPVTTAARTDTPVFARDAATALDQFPVIIGSQTGYQALAAVPVGDGRQIVGVIGLSWTHAQTLTEKKRQEITTLTTRVGRLLMRDLAPGDLELGNVTTVLGVLSDPWMILRALDDRPAGLVIEASAPGRADIDRHVGQRLLAAYPSLAADPVILDQLTALLRDGGLLVLQTPDSNTSGAPWGTAPVALRVTRVGSRLILAWRAQPTSQP
jgi:hypothetical protein